MLLSIVTACYNYGRYLPDCVHSIIGGPTSLGIMPGQDLHDLEIIIVDDCSTDETEQIGREFAQDPRIQYVRHEENLGTAAAYNTGVRASCGEFVTMLSADDMRESWSLSLLVHACQEHGLVMAYDDVCRFADGHRGQVIPLPGCSFEAEVRRNILHAGIVYPRQVWEDVGGYPEVMADGREEWAFGIALYLAGWKPVHVRRPGYLYRVEGQNRSLRNSGRDYQVKWARALGALYPEAFKRLRPQHRRGQTSRRDVFLEEALRAGHNHRGGHTRDRVLA